MSIAIPKDFIELSVVKPVFHLQSLYYFGIKGGVPPWWPTTFVQQVFLATVHWLLVHQGQVGEIAFRINPLFVIIEVAGLWHIFQLFFLMKWVLVYKL
jgi:hypothetical protein